MTYDYNLRQRRRNEQALTVEVRLELIRLLEAVGGHDGWVRRIPEDGSIGHFAARTIGEIESEDEAVAWRRLIAILDRLGCDLHDCQTGDVVAYEAIRVDPELAAASRLLTESFDHARVPCGWCSRARAARRTATGDTRSDARPRAHRS